MEGCDIMITDAYRDSYDEIQLHENISIPSKVHAYSLGVEYMRNWFINKFDNLFGRDYFRTVYINGKYIFDDYRRFNRTELIKVEKPALSITPTIDYEYNRDMVDVRLGGLDILTRRSRFNQNLIIQDRDNNYFLRMFMELVRINFTFRVRVSTKAQQLEIYNLMKYAFRLGATQKEFVSYDFHLPYEAMLNMASHAGFGVIKPNEENEKKSRPRVSNITEFLKYLNSHSTYPVSYKMRTVNGNSEFFIRVPDNCTHISNLDSLSLDDGERENQLDNNFHIDMSCVLSIPCPQMYIYYSSEALELAYKHLDEIAGLYSIRALVPPSKDEHGWDQYISTEYVDEDNNVPEIDLTGLIEGSDLYRAIKYNVELHISPSIFVNVKLFNNQYERITTMDWENMVIRLKEPKLRSDYSQITLYVDMEYMNNQIAIIDRSDSTRMTIKEPKTDVSICSITPTLP